MTDLSNRTALVTGASRGIGRAAAARLAKDGAHVIVHYSASADQADTLVAEIRAAGGKADAIGADLTTLDGPAKLAEGVKALGITKLDVLIANAGTATFGTLETQEIDDFDRQFALNVRAPFFLLQALNPILSDGASVIFTSSVVARIGFAGAAAYAATKGAVDSLVKSFALELGPRNIRVNAVAPGAIETDLASFLQDPQMRQNVLSVQALQRIGQVEDTAGVYAFLASDDARWVTGRVIEASGGAYLRS